jgi:hypothetical protein
MPRPIKSISLGVLVPHDSIDDIQPRGRLSMPRSIPVTHGSSQVEVTNVAAAVFSSKQLSTLYSHRAMQDGKDTHGITPILTDALA